MDEDLHRLVDERESVFKVVVFLPEDAWHKFSSELLWAEALEDGTMRILNIPFFAKGLSIGDVISIRIESEGIFFNSIVSSGGHSTYRLIRNESVDDETFKQMWSGLAELGCTYESFLIGPTYMYAIDVPPSADVRNVYSLLEAGEKDEIWDFDEGNYAGSN
ncbi:DUF4265 domain-containing protein [Ralstonia solanacearum]|uniref:DUF4265 domain-containing protein n=4 Tax=Ralstonia solanacearum TaxID=305 RepID=UPI0009BC000E|nr:DUF4265 domain-containing protein [Ralstonia solanacearum]MCL9828163.1 DUF4265 domain-containing protein [Ralstonia solanacearum]MCL9832935.1 DUF4265 domain-containing protein [Ralstonia solanacearum]MCL9837716.1 DUF4265 domain-containing protein [Ralstonia solanacearum]